MNNQLRWTKNAARLCADIGAEDGIDPRHLAAKQARKKTPRKNLQLRFRYAGAPGKGVC